MRRLFALSLLLSGCFLVQIPEEVSCANDAASYPRCDGQTLSICKDTFVFTFDCASAGLVCDAAAIDPDRNSTGSCVAQGGAVCGNGTLEDGEECDDGNTAPNDGCSPVCRPEHCGDNIVQANEECDDGNTTSGDGCSDLCKLEKCGNGTLEAGEQCDDGNNANGDGCDANCASETACGNSSIEPSEGCDDGNTTSGDGCSDQCRLEFCGDGIVGNNSLLEQCDDGNTTNGDGCDANCAASFCGNGILDPNESCEGNVIGCNSCQISPATCGDNIAQPFEQCERNSFNQSICGTDCRFVSPTCGDGSKSLLESCDDGNLANNDGCNSLCQPEFCGDGIRQAQLGEQCDDGDPRSNDGCNASCQNSALTCGNGIVDSGETCDDGNNNDNDLCTNRCVPSGCGNRVIESNEICHIPFSTDVSTDLAPQDIHLVDLNHDGLNDLLIAAGQTGNLELNPLLADQNGVSFRRSVHFITGGQLVAIQHGDFNSDGNVDIVAANAQNHTVELFFGDGHLGLSGPLSLPAGNTPRDLAVADVDNDGHDDILVASRGSNAVTVLLGAGDGTFAAPLLFQVGAQPIAIVVAQIDGQGALDVLTANESGSVSVLRGAGAGFFVPYFKLNITQAKPRRAALADFDNDNDLDLVVATEQDNQLRTFLNDGVGFFVTDQTIQLNDIPTGIAVADFDGAGLADILVSLRDTHKVQLFVKAFGTFQPSLNFNTPAAPTNLRIEDFNRDTIPDIFTTNQDSSLSFFRSDP